MTKYRIDTGFTRLSDGARFESHVIEFDTEATPRSIVLDRLKSIAVVVLRTICHVEDIPTEGEISKWPIADPRLKMLEKGGILPVSGNEDD